MTELVANTSVDIGIVINPAEHADLIIKKIINTDFTFWSAHDKSPVQTFSSGAAVIICDTNIPQTHQLLKELSSKNLDYARVSTANNQETIANLTINGCGIGILPSCVVAAFYADQLKRIENAPYCRNSMSMIFRKENKEIAAIEIVMNTLKECIAKFLSP
jgi:DNA-binding transcriptional LysR family regulator